VAYKRMSSASSGTARTRSAGDILKLVHGVAADRGKSSV
jgi:hypothetical protein